MEFYFYCMDDIYGWRTAWDRIGIGGGRGIIVGDKAAPNGVVCEIIFVYEKGGLGVDV